MDFDCRLNDFGSILNVSYNLLKEIMSSNIFGTIGNPLNSNDQRLPEFKLGLQLNERNRIFLKTFSGYI